MKIPLNEISTPGLLKLMRDVAAELENRLGEHEVRRVQATRPTTVLREPPDDDVDFALMLKARLQRGEYVKAHERERLAKIAEWFGPWVERQGLPTTHNAGDWRRAAERVSAPRAKKL